MTTLSPLSPTAHEGGSPAVLADGERLAVTVHCVDRFWERAAVGCTLFRHALARLQELASAIGAEAPRPESGWR